MFNNVIGLKPIHGLVNTRGVVPACRILDCVSIFAQTVLHASVVLAAARGFDELDPYSRLPTASSLSSSWSIAPIFRFGVPTLNTRKYFNDVYNPVLFQMVIDVISQDLGGEPVEFDFIPFFAGASYLEYYTNFVNLLDLAMIAVPAGIRPDALSFGVTLIGHAFSDIARALLADHVHRTLSTALLVVQRVLWWTHQNCLRLWVTRCLWTIFLSQLSMHIYQVNHLTISLKNEKLDSYASATRIPSIDDGCIVKGFLVESSAVVNAQDITHLGEWWAYINSLKTVCIVFPHITSNNDCYSPFPYPLLSPQ
jgi:hypothetical protein